MAIKRTRAENLKSFHHFVPLFCHTIRLAPPILNLPPTSPFPRETRDNIREVIRLELQRSKRMRKRTDGKSERITEQQSVDTGSLSNFRRLVKSIRLPISLARFYFVLLRLSEQFSLPPKRLERSWWKKKQNKDEGWLNTLTLKTAESPLERNISVGSRETTNATTNACSLSLQRARQKKREKERNGWKRDAKHFFTGKSTGTCFAGEERTDGGRLRWSIKARPVVRTTKDNENRGARSEGENNITGGIRRSSSPCRVLTTCDVDGTVREGFYSRPCRLDSTTLDTVCP